MSVNDPTSQSLLIRLAASEPDAWDRLVKLYSPLVAHWCRQWGVRGDAREDLTQEVFAAVAHGMGSYARNRPEASFRAWIRGITRHKLQDHFRRTGMQAEGGTAAMARLRDVPESQDEPDLSESDDQVTALYGRALDLVRNQFEERTWNAFWKVAMENRSPAEVATEMGLTPSTVRQAKSRILRRLKEELGELIA
jgi:RNA polymerase sigma-70 factor (ECF subfamily)